MNNIHFLCGLNLGLAIGIYIFLYSNNYHHKDSKVQIHEVDKVNTK